MSSDLSRFLEAQEPIHSTALQELKRGHKQTHWMWFIFPQLAGLGASSMAICYAINSRSEARDFLHHPILGRRLVECTEALLAVHDRTAHQILGSPDDLKLRSSMTLFAAISPPASLFHQIIDQYYKGEMDPKTLLLLKTSPP